MASLILSEALEHHGDRTPTILLAAQDDVRFKLIEDVIEVATACGYRQFVMRAKGDYPFDVAPITAQDVLALPTVHIKLTSEPNGHLVAIELNERHVDSFGELNSLLLEAVGKETSPGTYADRATVELDCDPDRRANDNQSG